ncbi:DNA-binding PadR family transcriptional regulator [Methanococcus maripaludis]|uniref:DNA-binding PadR family transcriptional regulator n=1 Tax=Methanococcus maripaludis TaxID=39152 RepID=A0A7J9P1V9_METMI|nr:PadR family transcriptional regulator [Methanococcus maripaludis]MBA2852016.1 DNA-binding PadR family transcriptional regulator [Methanococcus maripaludis]
MKHGKKVKELIKILILKFLEKENLHGYILISNIKEITGISVSPSMVYPILSNLKTAGLIEVEKTEDRGKKIYKLTKDGHSFLDKNQAKVEYCMKKSEALYHFHNFGGIELKKALHLAFEEFIDMDDEKRKKIGEIMQKCAKDIRYQIEYGDD